MPDFDPDKYLASEDFNPDEYLSKVQQPRMTPLDAGISKLSQGLTLGYADELLGGVEAAGAEVGERLGLTEPKDAMQRYREFRNIHRARAAQAEQDQPEVALGADIVGSGITAFSPAGAALMPVKGAGAIANAGRVLGAGALTAAGGSSADLTTGKKSEYEDFAKDVATGAGVNAAATAALKPIGYAAGKISPEYLKKIANERAVKAAVGQNKKVFKDLTKTGQLQKTGADLLEDGTIGWFSKAEDILPKAKAQKEAYGKAIGEIGKEIDKMAPAAVDGTAIATKLEGVLADIPATPKNDGVRNALQKEIDFYKTKPAMSFSEAQKLKGSYVFKPTDSTTQTLGQDVTNEARRAVSSEMESAAARIAKDPSIQPKTKDQLLLYEKLKSKYGSMSTAVKAGQERELSNLSNRFASPSDYAAGLGGGMAGVMAAGANPAAAVTGLAAAGANKFARERGSAFAARTADKLAKIMAADPAGLNRFRGVLEDAARRGPQALMLTHTLLSEDPEYQQTLESQP
jgi:hypothetical protein